MILLIGDEVDPLIDSVAVRAARLGHECLMLTETDLVENLEVDDRICGDTTSLHWTVKGHAFGTADVCGVLNRLDDLTLAPFGNVDSDEKLFAWQELRAYLLFALRLFPNVLNGPAGQEWATAAPSPSRQWSTVRRAVPGFAVPRWSWVTRGEIPYWAAYPGRIVNRCDALGPPQWRPSGDADTRARPLLHEVPVGHRVDLTVVDSQVLAWRSGQPLAEHVRASMTDLVSRLPMPVGLRLATVTLFHCPELSRITFGSVAPVVDVDSLTEDQRDAVAFGILSAFDHRDRPCPRGRRTPPTAPCQGTTIVPRHRVTDGPALRRRRPTPRCSRNSVVNIVADACDPAARHLHLRARRRRTPVTWWTTDDLDAAAEQLRDRLGVSGHGFYLRRPATSDTDIADMYRVVDELLLQHDGPVVGAGLDHSTNHSKPLHVATLHTIPDDAVLVPRTTIRSSTVAGDGDNVAKGLSSAKSEVVLLDSVNGNPQIRYRVPVLTQERIDGRNIRVHVVADEVIAVRIGSEALDYRFGSFAVQSCSVTADVARWCRQAAGTERLAFAGVDLIETPNATWCLEVNPNPGYHVFEQRMPAEPNRYRVSDALLNYLRSGVRHG